MVVFNVSGSVSVSVSGSGAVRVSVSVNGRVSVSVSVSVSGSYSYSWLFLAMPSYSKPFLAFADPAWGCDTSFGLFVVPFLYLSVAVVFNTSTLL